MATQKARFQFRSDTAAAWAIQNPILAEGEPGFEEDTGLLRMGDGVTAFTSLIPYAKTNAVPPLARQIATDNAAGTDGGGDLSANRTIRLSGQALRLHQLAVNGFVTRVDATTLAGRSIAGTADQINVANPAGAAGNPTLSLMLPNQTEAEAGSDANKPMPSLRVRQAIDARVFGIGQTWQNLTGSRAANTTYQNTTGKAIEVKIVSTNVTGTVTFSTGATAGTLEVRTQTGTGGGTAIVHTNGCIVPPGWFYSYSGTIDRWSELRA